MELSSLNFTLPYELRSAKNIYLITPNQSFNNAWKSCNPNQANPDNWKHIVIDANKEKLLNTLGLSLPVSHIGFETVDGEPRLDFIDGIHRFQALKELGLTAIPCLIEGDNLDPKHLPAFMKPISPDFRKKLENKEGQSGGIELPSLDPEYLKKWAKQPEIAEKLLEIFTERYGAAIAQECLAYYQDHGKTPPSYEIERMNRETEKKARLEQKPENRQWRQSQSHERGGGFGL